MRPDDVYENGEMIVYPKDYIPINMFFIFTK